MLAQVDFGVQRNGGCGSNPTIFIDLMDTDLTLHKPTGTAKATSSGIACSSLALKGGGGGGGNLNRFTRGFTFSSCNTTPCVTAGTQYALVVRASGFAGSSNAMIVWGDSNADDYTSGQQYKSSDGVAWSTFGFVTAGDLLFATYIGTPPPATENKPIQVGAATSWTSVAAGDQHNCALQGGSLFCWGLNDHRQSGAIGFSAFAPPTQI